MKKIIFVVFLGLFLGSCNEWLKVSPRSETPAEELFTDVDGFKSALTGVYLEMIDDKAYGEYLTMSKIENLVNFWSTEAKTGEEALSLHNYQDAKAESIIRSMYEHLYKVILATNAILEHIDGSQDLFSVGEYEAVKGECLAIRALCHFDLLRLFGPVPSEAGGSPVLSYVTRVSKDLNPLLPVSEYRTKLYEDLEKADVLLKQFQEVQTQMNDEFFYSAQRRVKNIRMNWYALTGLRARVALWFGEKEQAYGFAKTVIEAKDDQGAPLFRLGSSSDFENEDMTLPSEHLFALYRFDMKKLFSRLYTGKGLYNGKNANSVSKVLYGSTGSDIREQSLWSLIQQENGSSYNVIQKYKERKPKFYGDEEIQNIPLIRLSEMYLIAAETAPLGEAQALMDKFLYSRNINKVDLPEDTGARGIIILSEYQKEFFAEGQAFYAYKRLNLPKESEKWLWVQEDMQLNYVLPLPKTEIINH